MQKPKVAVVGYGFAGKCFHSYLVSLVPEFELKGIASRDPATREKIGKERNCATYPGFESVLRDPEVDLVVLATPNSTHAKLAVRALRAGKHVVTDKVMCLNLREFDVMAAAAQESGRLLTVFQNRRWDGDYLTVKQLMADGKLGDVRWMEMAWQGFGAWGGWRGQAKMGGGKLYDLGAHLIDQVVMLFPERITSVFCRLHHDFPQTDTDSQAMVIIGFESGRTAVCDVSSLAAIQKPRFHVFGTGGTFVKYGVDPQERAMIDGHIDTAAEDEKRFGRLHDGKTETVVPTQAGRWRDYYENVAAVLIRGEAPAVKLPEVRRAIAVLDAAFRSARTGKAVKVDIPPADEAPPLSLNHDTNKESPQ